MRQVCVPTANGVVDMPVTGRAPAAHDFLFGLTFEFENNVAV